MKFTSNHPTLGLMVYEESFWSGKKRFFVNGVELTKQSKTAFIQHLDNGDMKTYFVSGDFMRGVKITSDGVSLQIIPKPKALEIVLSVLIFVVALVWGNSPALCSILPIVGGGIGGGISALMAMCNLYIIRNQSSAIKKILISLGMTFATLFTCFITALAILSIFA